MWPPKRPLTQANGIARRHGGDDPRHVADASTAGEKRVFATLARLPDNCLIYSEPVVRRRYPDLIAILPEVGVLVIEVKDWWLAELSSVNADTVTITRRGTATVVPHPRRQARGYMLRLMDRLRR
jgi:nuclease-like protein